MNQSSQELLNHMKSTKDKTEYMKFQAMHLYKVENKSANEVAQTVGTSNDMIYQWAHRYKKFGVLGLINKPRGGRKWSFMSIEEEKAMLDELTKDATKGLVVVSKVIRNVAEKKLGHPVSADYAEDILNRHGWRKIMPRPKHPKSSKEVQEEFKKKCQTLSPKRQVHLKQKTKDL